VATPPIVDTDEQETQTPFDATKPLWQVVALGHAANVQPVALVSNPTDVTD
jgi:hypothetical protein